MLSHGEGTDGEVQGEGHGVFRLGDLHIRGLHARSSSLPYRLEWDISPFFFLLLGVCFRARSLLFSSVIRNAFILSHLILLFFYL